MKIDSNDFRVPAGKDVDLAKWPTLGKPACKSKKHYRMFAGAVCDDVQTGLQAGSKVAMASFVTSLTRDSGAAGTARSVPKPAVLPRLTTAGNDTWHSSAAATSAPR